MEVKNSDNQANKKSSLLKRIFPFPRVEASVSNDILVKNMTEIGWIIAHDKRAQDEPLGRWMNAHAQEEGTPYKGAAFVFVKEGEFPSIVLQQYGLVGHACLEYFNDGTFMASFDKGMLPEGVVFSPVNKEDLSIQQYTKRAFKGDKFVTSVFKIKELNDKTLNYLNNFSKEALIAFKQIPS